MPDGIRHPAGSQILDGTAGCREILEREVDAPPLVVTPDITKDVRQLQRHAEVQGIVLRPLASAAEDPDADHADRRGHAPAVFEQLHECVVPRLVDVHRHAIHHILERLSRQLEPDDEGLKPPALQRLRNQSVVAARQLRAPDVATLPEPNPTPGPRRPHRPHRPQPGRNPTRR